MSEKDLVNERKRCYNSIKPATYDESGSWHDYRAHFEACAKINEWTEEQKGLYLSVSTRTGPRRIWQYKLKNNQL
ncbi:hypothetical protein DPMN_025650 [Dreissena polymorpha]|uniref:Uncharacterized protein n=1 Tax=Dreissena polymorpha TaxID=45954 RepID=A0A9D4LRZ9_DREPO|nr:hypothetical protein DPMN_025650 [Dreissena polymorpha]